MLNRQQNNSRHRSALVLRLLPVFAMFVGTTSAIGDEEPVPNDPEIPIEATDESKKIERSQLTITCYFPGPYERLAHLAAVVALIATMVFAIRGSHPLWSLVFLSLPLMAGGYASFHQKWKGDVLFSQSSMEPQLSEVSANLASSLSIFQDVLLLTTPSYIIIVSGLLYRSAIRTRAKI